MSSRNAVVMLALTLFAPVTAHAQVVCLTGCPGVGNSLVPACITLVGRSGAGVVDPAGTFVVVVRDLANNPRANALVRLDLNNAPDLHLCTTQQPGLIVSAVPGAMYIEGRSDAAGVFSTALVGGSNGAGGASTLFGGGRIFIDGTLAGSPTVSTYDLDGSGGVGINDLSVWLSDFGSSTANGRSDYDCNSFNGINDLAIWLAAYGSSQSAVGCTP